MGYELIFSCYIHSCILSMANNDDHDDSENELTGCNKCDDPEGDLFDCWATNRTENYHCEDCRCRWCVCEHMRAAGKYEDLPRVRCKGGCWHCEWETDYIWRREHEYVDACMNMEMRLSANIIRNINASAIIPWLPVALAELVLWYWFQPPDDVCRRVCAAVCKTWLNDRDYADIIGRRRRAAQIVQATQTTQAQITHM